MDDHLPFAEEIPDDKGGCPTCKAMLPSNPRNALLMARTGYCSSWCWLRSKFPILSPADPENTESRKEMT